MFEQPDYLAGSLVAAAILAVLALAAAVRRAAPGERLVVRRGGRVRAVAGPGFRLVLPLLDRVSRVRVRPIEADLWCRTRLRGASGARDGEVALVQGRAVFEVSDVRRYAADPDAALDLACRAAERALCDFAASREPGMPSAARVPETAGLKAVRLELVDPGIPPGLRTAGVMSPEPEEKPWN